MMHEVNIKVTWHGYVCEVMRVYEHLTEEGKRDVLANLLKMAEVADLHIKQQKEVVDLYKQQKEGEE